MGERESIDCTLKNRMEVFKVGMRYPGRIDDGDRRDRRIDDEVFWV